MKSFTSLEGLQRFSQADVAALSQLQREQGINLPSLQGLNSASLMEALLSQVKPDVATPALVPLSQFGLQEALSNGELKQQTLKNQEEIRKERAEKRRSQIAAASRKSRAKRKQELINLKCENERLWKEILALKSGLGKKELQEEIKEEKADELKSICSDESQDENDVMLSKLTSFLEARMRNFYDQLKVDTVAHFSQGLSYPAKKKLSSLEVEFHFNMSNKKRKIN
eukprot:snap_masked-scaffold_16-processed-gene-4.31-mRNA-1 protein AED:1.00 eAED:1.00 QI:0/-1/0/0/-1/1/1/0/226